MIDTINFEILKDFKHARDLIDGTEMIPLETNSKNLIGSVGKVLIRNGNFYLLDNYPGKNGIYRIDSSGTITGSVVRIGRGPGEYKDILDFDVDGNGNIMILNSLDGKILVFDSELTYVYSVVPEISINAFAVFCDFIVAVSRRNNYRNPDSKLLYILEKSGKIVDSYFPFSEATTNTGSMNMLVGHEGKLYINMPYIPVIYSIDTLFRISAEYYLVNEYIDKNGKVSNRFQTDPFKVFFKSRDFIYVSTSYKFFYSGFYNGSETLFFTDLRTNIAEGYIDPFPLFGIIKENIGLMVHDADFLKGNFEIERRRLSLDRQKRASSQFEDNNYYIDTLSGSLFDHIKKLSENDNPCIILVELNPFGMKDEIR